MKKILQFLPGVFLCIIIALCAKQIAIHFPLGSVTISILIGMIIGNTKFVHKNFEAGIKLSEKKVLATAIAMLGLKLNFQILNQLGLKSILLVICALIITILSALTLAKIFKFNKKFALLLGIGNGVCGSSAIAATEEIIGAEKEQVGLSIAIVNFLGVIGMFLLPLFSKNLLNFSDINSGILAGNTLQAVGQVVAAGFSVNETAGQTATIIKMTRILMLFPLILGLIFSFSKNKTNKKISIPKIPGFIIGFVLLSLIPSFNILPVATIKSINHISSYLLVTAMAAIGLKISIGTIIKQGKSALKIGSLIFIIQIIFSSISLLFFFNN